MMIFSFRKSMPQPTKDGELSTKFFLNNITYSEAGALIENRSKYINMLLLRKRKMNYLNGLILYSLNGFYHDLEWFVRTTLVVSS